MNKRILHAFGKKILCLQKAFKKQLRMLVEKGKMCVKAGNWDQSEGFLTKIDRLNTSIYRFSFLTSRLDLSAAMLILMMGDKSAWRARQQI